MCISNPLGEKKPEKKKAPTSTCVLVDTVIQENDDPGNGNLETVILFYIIRLVIASNFRGVTELNTASKLFLPTGKKPKIYVRYYDEQLFTLLACL